MYVFVGCVSKVFSGGLFAQSTHWRQEINGMQRKTDGIPKRQSICPR